MVNFLRDWANKHPKLAAWAGLSVGMVVILLIAARDVDLTASARLFLIVATIGLAGACVAIIGWDSDDENIENIENIEPPKS